MQSPSGPVNNRPDRPHAYVLDDDREIVALTATMLGTMGLTPTEFFEPTSFLNEVKKTPPWVVILDLSLGKSDAVEVIQQLATFRYRGRVLLISGRDEATLSSVTEIGKSHGLAMLPPLGKPFRASELKERLRTAPATKAAPLHDKRVDLKEVTLAHALINNWLELWYQPKVDLKSQSICGAEAMIRAVHPEHGIVLPAKFLPPVGDPLYHQLTKFILRRIVNDWQYFFASLEAPITLSANVPASVIRAKGFVTYVRDSLPRDSRFAGLLIESTEDEVTHTPELFDEIATQLKLYNVRLSIDDFELAYSMVERLRSLPFVELKLDRRFVLNCSSIESKRHMCQCAIDLAHKFGATACAENVETIHDLKALIEMGCDTAQGYLFAKPMPPKALLAMLHAPSIQPLANANSSDDAPDNEIIKDLREVEII